MQIEICPNHPTQYVMQILTLPKRPKRMLADQCPYKPLQGCYADQALYNIPDEAVRIDRCLDISPPQRRSQTFFIYSLH